MDKKKKLIIYITGAVLLILAAVFALLCLGEPSAAPAPEQTEPTVSTNPTVAPTTGSTAAPTEPTESTAPSVPVDPTETAQPSTPTNPTEFAVSSTPTAAPTTQPTSPAYTQPTKAPTQPTTPSTTPATQPSTSSNVPQLRIKSKKPSVLIGGTFQLDYTYTGKGTLTWTSDDPSKVTVDQNGVVRGVDSGYSMVTVTDGNLKTRVLVYVDAIIIRTPSNLTIGVGEKLNIDYTFLSKTASLSWSSSDTSVFTIDNNGVVTGIGTGVALATATDDWGKWSIYINVVSNADRTVGFDLQIDCPLYDGVTKFVGHYLQINQLNSHTQSANGRWNDVIDHWQAAGSASDPCKPDPQNPSRNYYITSSNPDVVSIANKYDCGFYDDFLYFNKAGTSVITFTSWDGYSESYTIYVKDDYDCAPKKTKLTPGEFAYYATMVGVEDGLEASYQIRSYLYIWYDEDELTWERAKGLGHANAKREFYLNSDTTIIVYAGFDESNGKHLFYHGMGEPDGKMEPYTPANPSTGKIRFPSKSMDIMEKSLKVVEVLGDTKDEFVVYTSSDPSIVEASGSMLVAKKPGTAVITATYKGQIATMTVNVTMDPTIERVIFEQDTYSIPLNDALSLADLKYTYNGTSELKWECSNTDIVYIDVMGTLVPCKEGECTIWLRSVDNYFVCDCCTIIVTEPIDYPDATDIIFRDTGDTLYNGMVATVGDVFVIDAYTIPADSRAQIQCSSFNYLIIHPSFEWDPELGRTVYRLVCNKAGTTTIILASSDGCVSKEYTIVVKPK